MVAQMVPMGLTRCASKRSCSGSDAASSRTSRTRAALRARMRHTRMCRGSERVGAGRGAAAVAAGEAGVEAGVGVVVAG